MRDIPLVESSKEIARLRAINAKLEEDLQVFIRSNGGLTDDVLSLRAINAELLAALEWATKQIGILSPYIETPQALASFNDCLAAIAKAKGE